MLAEGLAGRCARSGGVAGARAGARPLACSRSWPSMTPRARRLALAVGSKVARASPGTGRRGGSATVGRHVRRRVPGRSDRCGTRAGGGVGLGPGGRPGASPALGRSGRSAGDAGRARVRLRHSVCAAGVIAVRGRPRPRVRTRWRCAVGCVRCAGWCVRSWTLRRRGVVPERHGADHRRYGALGGHVARRLARAGAERVVLTSRRGMDAPAQASCARRSSSSARAAVAACDMADRAAVARRAGRSPRRTADAVFHAAGVLDDGVARRD